MNHLAPTRVLKLLLAVFGVCLQRTTSHPHGYWNEFKVSICSSIFEPPHTLSGIETAPVSYHDAKTTNHLSPSWVLKLIFFIISISIIIEPSHTLTGIETPKHYRTIHNHYLGTTSHPHGYWNYSQPLIINSYIRTTSHPHGYWNFATSFHVSLITEPPLTLTGIETITILIFYNAHSWTNSHPHGYQNKKRCTPHCFYIFCRLILTLDIFIVIINTCDERS